MNQAYKIRWLFFIILIIIGILALIFTFILNPLSIIFYSIGGVLLLFYKIILVAKLKEMDKSFKSENRKIKENEELKADYNKVSAPPKEFCIRCGVEKPFNPDYRFCDDCFKTWAEFWNEDYPENFCRQCGKSFTTSFRKPLCDDCYWG